MASKAEKRVILFLVEGQNDEAALIPPFKSLVKDRARVFSQAFHCDVTVAHLFKGSGQLSIKRDVCETVRTFVLEYLERGQGYQWEDIALIVHIVDIDGAFVPSDFVIEDPAIEGIEYSAECIRCSDKAWVEKRNSEKARSLHMLVRKHALSYRKKKVSYFVYFMSRNFEHALLGIEKELSNKEKDRLAQLFRKAYAENPKGFVSLLEGAASGMPDGYRESWEFIEEGTRSLERHSNLLRAIGELASCGRVDGSSTSEN